jgi:signal transduction histidine kinase
MPQRGGRLARIGPDPLIEAVARIPVTVSTKLLVAFGATGVLLVLVGVLGLQVIGQSDQRVTALRSVQERASLYRELQTDAAQLRALLALRVIGEDETIFSGATPPTPESLVVIDRAVATTLARPGRPSDLSQLPADLPEEDRAALTGIIDRFAQVDGIVDRIIVLDTAGDFDASAAELIEAERVAVDLERETRSLAQATQGLTDRLVTENANAFQASQATFVAVAVVAILLSVLLGLLLAWSVIRPIRRIETRLEGIAAGDFSSHVDVPNRDELGALALNINRMNDELGRLYAALESASRHKSEFLASMSHELRTPLNAVIGFSQVLKQQMFGELNPRQAQYVTDILESGQHLLSLINDILDLAKVEAGRMELQPSTFALNVTMENAVAMLRERATRQSITLESEIEPSVDLIEADERKVKQILFNLLSNAVKFTPAGGRVTVSARPLDDGVEIGVRDTGVGISAGDQARVFDEFEQLGPGRIQEGTGLGLALTRRLAELHGGRIAVESELGEGSKFTVWLPFRQPRPAEPLEESVAASGVAS